MRVVLEGVMQADDVRVLLVRQVLQHLLLGDRMLDALGTALQQVVLAEHLNSDNFLRASVPRHHHTPELALAEDTAEGKVFDAGLSRFVRHLQAGPFPALLSSNARGPASSCDVYLSFLLATDARYPETLVSILASLMVVKALTS